MLLKLCRPYLVGVLFLGGCMPYSCSSGKLGTQMTPWEFRTQYAYWDEHTQDMTGGRASFPLRGDGDGGAILNIRLHGFIFNPSSDRRTWNAIETDHFQRSLRTEPSMFISVTLANKLSKSDTVELDPNNPITTNDKPRISVLYFPGQPKLSNSSTYPDKEVPYGSKVSVKLKFSSLEKKPGPLGVVSGQHTCTVDKAGGDPDEAVTGEITANFQAQVEGERLSECNDATTGLGNSVACDNLDPKNP